MNTIFKNIKVAAIALFLVATSTVAFADPCVPGDADFDAEDCAGLGGNVGTPVGQSGNPGGASGVPIDGGASLLIASGVAFGIRKMRKNNAKA